MRWQNIIAKGSFNNVDISGNLRFTNTDVTGIRVMSRHPVFIDNSGLLNYNNTIFTSTTRCSFNRVSDEQLKHNEFDISNGLEIVKQLNPVTYQKTKTFKTHDFSGILTEPYILEAGFIAQEVEDISDLSFTVFRGDISTSYALNQNNICTYGISGLQELDNKVKEKTEIIYELSNNLAILREDNIKMQEDINRLKNTINLLIN